MTSNITPLDLCESCIATHEGMEIDWHIDALPATHIMNMFISRAAHDENGNPRQAIDEDDTLCDSHFATHCDGCDTKLAGERYCYIGITR